MGSTFTAAYQGYSYMNTTHTNRKCLVVFVATFEQLLHQMMGSSTKTVLLCQMVVLLTVLFHQSPLRKEHQLRETDAARWNTGEKTMPGTDCLGHQK